MFGKSKAKYEMSVCKSACNSLKMEGIGHKAMGCNTYPIAEIKNTPIIFQNKEPGHLKTQKSLGGGRYCP